MRYPAEPPRPAVYLGHIVGLVVPGPIARILVWLWKMTPKALWQLRQFVRGIHEGLIWASGQLVVHGVGGDHLVIHHPDGTIEFQDAKPQ